MTRDDDLIRRGDARTLMNKACDLAIKWAASIDKDNRMFSMERLSNEINSIPAVPREMTAREYAAHFNRMCLLSNNCAECPLGNAKGDYFCREYQINKPDIAVKTVEQWATEHPEKKRKTYAEDFFEKFPKSAKHTGGKPPTCRKEVYGGVCPVRYDCVDCWNEPMPEENNG